MKNVKKIIKNRLYKIIDKNKFIWIEKKGEKTEILKPNISKIQLKLWETT